MKTPLTDAEGHFWHVSTRCDVGAMAQWLSADQMRGRKADELGPWLAGVRELQEARDPATRRARMGELVAEFRAARVYRPPAPLETSAPDRGRTEAVAAIHRWSETEPGPLSCERYSAYRAAHDPSEPHRNTLARRFGSWAAALEAAGLGDRAASTREVRETRVAGGAKARSAYDEVQRQRVLKTLRFAVNIDGYGTLPTAMQFFRWRLINAPATPSQATVYRLFPGGWPAVLAAYEASGDQPSLA